MNEEVAHVIGYGTHIMVWLSLLVLTALTVAVAGMNLGAVNVFTALMVAAWKASLVLLFFMHLRYEHRIFTLMTLLTIIVLTIIIGFTFFDTLFRTVS